MISKELVSIILGEIGRIEKEYQFSQGMILSEDDFKCHLFAKIISILPQAMPTFNEEVMGSPLHAEVNFFDEKENLTIRPDISIIDPAHLSIFHSLDFEVKRGVGTYNQFSSKCFEVGGSAIMIELKFCKDRNGISDRDVTFFETDLKKIVRLQRIVRDRSNSLDKIYGIFVILNKTDIGEEKVAALRLKYAASTDIVVVYATGKVDFTGKNSNIFDSGYHVDVANIC